MHPVDLFMVYSFIKRLVMPFDQWKAFQVGLIDAQGNFLVSKENRNDQQRSAMSYFDILILNLKRLLMKLPGGATRIATIAAALFLLREGKIVSESAVEDKISAFENKYNSYLDKARIFVKEDAAAVPANNMSGGAIASDPEVMTGVKKILRRNKKLVTGNNAS